MTASPESSVQHELSKEDAFREISLRIAAKGESSHKAEILRELYHNGVLYKLEVKVETAPGEYSLWTYQRKGRYPNIEDPEKFNDAKVTNISVAYFVKEDPVGGYTVAEYDEETGEWKDV